MSKISMFIILKLRATYLLCIFNNFYYVYSKILKFKLCFENCPKNKREKQKMTQRVFRT